MRYVIFGSKNEKPKLDNISTRAGFTIVEVVIAVVIIAILASITIIGYNMVTKQSVETSLKADLQAVKSTLTMESRQTGSYPAPASASFMSGGQVFKASGDNILTYTVDGSQYCAAVRNPQYPYTFYVSSQTGQVKPGDCSEAGNVWTAQTTPTNAWSEIVYGNGVFLATASGSVSAPETPGFGSTSTNGTSWSNAFSVGSGSAIDPSATYGGGKFVVKYELGKIPSAASSNNGVTWQNNTPGATSQYQGNSVAYGAGVYVSTVSSPPETYTRVFTSTDGLTWTNRTTTIPWYTWSAVTYSNGKFVAVGTNQVMVSTNGISWTLSATPPSGTWSAVTYGNGLFVAVGRSGTNRVMTSPDGVTWTARTPAEVNDWSSVIYGNGKFVAVSKAGTNRVMTSPDGITWTARAAAAPNPWASVTYGAGCFVAVAPTGTNRAMTSCW